MSSLRGAGLRDIEVTPSRKALIQFNSSLDPSDEADALQLKAVLQGYASGAYTNEQMDRFLEKHPKARPFVSAVIKDRARFDIGQKYFDPGSPAVTPFEGEFAGKGALLPKEAVAPKIDLERAYAAAMSRGDVEFANSLLKGVEKPNKSGLYGGVQYAFDPEKKEYVPYSIDERTGRPVRIQTPEGTVATVPMTAQPGVGAQGPGFYQFPTRAPAGSGTSAVPGVTPMPTSEEAGSASKFSVAQDMAARLKEHLEKKRISVGPVAGRGLRLKGATGITLSDDEADVLSIEEQLGNLVLQAMRGAQVGPKEQEMFQRQLPRVDQPEALFKANINNTLRNLAQMQRILSTQRPIKSGGKTEAPAEKLSDRSSREDAALKALRGR